MIDDRALPVLPPPALAEGSNPSLHLAIAENRVDPIGDTEIAVH